MTQGVPLRRYLWCRWQDVKDWFLRIWFCHHNARVLVDMEHRLSCVLDHCTKSMSKPYYSLEAMYAEIDDFLQEQWQDGYNDGYNDGFADGDSARAEADLTGPR